MADTPNDYQEGAPVAPTPPMARTVLAIVALSVAVGVLLSWMFQP